MRKDERAAAPDGDVHSHMAARAGAQARVKSLRLELGDWATLGDAASRVRTAVFVREQGIPVELEWDAADAGCLHCVAFDGERPVGTGRLLPDGHIGRMAVLPDWRRAGLGGEILEHLVAAARARGDELALLNAQCPVESFYRRHGFETVGTPFDEAGIPHVAMRRSLR